MLFFISPPLHAFDVLRFMGPPGVIGTPRILDTTASRVYNLQQNTLNRTKQDELPHTSAGSSDYSQQKSPRQNLPRGSNYGTQEPGQETNRPGSKTQQKDCAICRPIQFYIYEKADQVQSVFVGLEDYENYTTWVIGSVVNYAVRFIYDPPREVSLSEGEDLCSKIDEARPGRFVRIVKPNNQQYFVKLVKRDSRCMAEWDLRFIETFRSNNIILGCRTMTWRNQTLECGGGLSEYRGMKLPAKNQATAPANEEKKLPTGGLEQSPANHQQLANPNNPVERLEAELTFDYAKIKEYNLCIGRLAHEYQIRGYSRDDYRFEQQIVRSCGMEPKPPEANEAERAAIKLATATAGSIHLLNDTDSQIAEMGQTTCAKLKDRHLINLCIQEFKSSLLTGYSCSSGRSWFPLSEYGRPKDKICREGATAGDVNLSAAKNVSEARQAINQQIEQECSRYKNQIATRLCKESGSQAAAPKLQGCGGVPTVITSMDFDEPTRAATCPTGKRAYGVHAFNYKVEMEAKGTVIALGRVIFSNGKFIFPQFSGAEDLLLYHMMTLPRDGDYPSPRYSGIPCHEVELQADQIVCRLGAAIITYKIPKNPNALTPDELAAPPQPFKACVRGLTVLANRDFSGYLKSKLDQDIQSQCNLLRYEQYN